jgi:hypothetical protein
VPALSGLSTRPRIPFAAVLPRPPQDIQAPGLSGFCATSAAAMGTRCPSPIPTSRRTRQTP